MSYIEYLKEKNKTEQGHPSTLDFAPELTGYGKIRCDLCGEVCDVTEGGSETSIVTDAATGYKRFYHFCYDCLHRKMDIDDVYGTYTEQETKTWRLKYKEAKQRPPRNSYADLCLNCFIQTNDIQMFEYNDDTNEWADFGDYYKNHKAYIAVSEGKDRYKDSGGDQEIIELHYSFRLRRCDNLMLKNSKYSSFGLRLCDGNGSMLCENCRFKTEVK